MSRTWPMYRALVGIGLLCGALIVTVYEVTKPVIARNQADALQKAVFRVLPAAETSRAFRFVEGSGFAPAEAEAGLIYAGYDSAGRLVGVAVEAAQMGYQDTIRLLYGYAPAEQSIVGMQVLESKETPGLGDKIEKDAAFLENFQALSAALNSAGDSLANPIVAVKHGEKTDAWQIDGITGATISSVAVAKALDDSASTWAPRIVRHASDLAKETRR
jgi:electron transport complex protein RnfG